MFLYPDDIDQKLNWPPGTAQKMARRRRLPHTVLPDGSVRFVWEDIESLLVRVEVQHPPRIVRFPGGPFNAA